MSCSDGLVIAKMQSKDADAAKARSSWSGDPMDVQGVVRLAKDYVRKLYADEQITNVGLEEVKFDHGSEVWRITIGFSRPWDAPAGFLSSSPLATTSRSLKVVNIDDKSGDVISMETRDVKQLVR